MNSKSSRSHAIFFLNVINHKTESRSTLYLVDLAGSERIKKSNVSGERIDEAIAINSSLTTLGKCIIALGDKKTAHVPYRESKLTKILQDALGGKCKTALIVTLSPQVDDLEETISSLLFGQRAKKVPIKPQVMERAESRPPADDLKKQLEVKTLLLQEMTVENRRLQQEIREMMDDQHDRRDDVIKKLEHKMKTLKKEHQTRLEDMDMIMLQQEKEICKLRERLTQDSVDQSRNPSTSQTGQEGRSQSKNNVNGGQKKLLEFPESSTGLKESNLNKPTNQSGKVQTKAGGPTNHQEGTNKENGDMSLENYLASHYLKKDGKDSRIDSSLVRELEQAKKDLEGRVRELTAANTTLQKANKEMMSEKQKLETENSQLAVLAHREDRENDVEESRSQIDALKEELIVLREENGYLKEMTQNLESENQALEEEIGMLQDKQTEGPCDKCEEVNREKNEVLSEVKIELENLKNRLTEINFENYELKDQNVRMTELISELRSSEKKLLKEKTDLEFALNSLQSERENERTSHHESVKYDQELLKQESQRNRLLEIEVDKWKRKDEEKEFQLESLGGDLAAMEAQLKISKMRSEELGNTCQKLESNIKRLETSYREKESNWMLELEKENFKLSKMTEEKTDIEQELEEINSEKLDLLNILEEYRKREAVNMTNEQDLERMKGRLLECDNWNATIYSLSNKRSLEGLINESKTKIEDYVDQLIASKSDLLNKIGTNTNQLPILESYRQIIKKTLVSYLSQSYFSDFEKKTLNLNSGRQLQDLLVEEYIMARQCIKELSSNLEGQVLNMLGARIEIKVQDKKLHTTSKNLDKFKKVLKDPAIEELKNEFLRVWLKEIRENRAAFRLQSFFKLIRQKRKSQNLQKRHKSQYERFQAGSGKNLLQLLMKKVEQSVRTVYEEVGTLEDDFKAINVARKLAKKSVVG